LSTANPRFSVVLPTRNRPETLRYALATCLAQDFDSYEIIVCDNSDPEQAREVAAVVAAAESPKIRHLPSDRPLAMSANWERGLGEAKGEYVTVLGDDDGLMPYALRELDRLASRTGAKAIRWQRIIYTWRTIGVEGEANLLLLPMSRTIGELDGRTQIAKVMRFEAGSDTLPMIYCSVIHRDLIAQHRQVAGRVFLNVYPDIYSAFGFGYLVGQYVSISAPMSIAGLSHASNGVATLMKEKKTSVATDFSRLNEAFGYVRHPLVPDRMILGPVHIADSFLHAKDALFPQDDDLPFDRKDFTQRCLGAIPETDLEDREHVRKIIRASIEDSPQLLEWFDAAPSQAPAPLHSFRPHRFGFDGGTLNLDVSSLDIHNVSDAARFSATMLGVGSAEIAFDVPPLSAVYAHVWSEQAKVAHAEQKAEQLRQEAVRMAVDATARVQALQDTCEQLDHQLHEARRTGALSNVPRRALRKVFQLFRKPPTAA
jgi:hypothetical protein